MTLRDACIELYRTCIGKRVQPDMDGHYQTKIDFGGRDVYVSPDGSDVIRYVFSAKGCKKTKVIRKNGKVVKVIHFHKDRLPVYGTITRSKGFKGFIYKYLLFLRCDGIEDKDLLLLYVLKMIRTTFEFWRKKPRVFTKWEIYEPQYEDIKKMLIGLVCSAVKKVIDDKTRDQFIVRTRCVVSTEHIDGDGARRKKTKKEKFRDARKGTGKATDNRIKVGYDPSRTDKENAEQLEISVRRLQNWKKKYLESPKDRIRRLYDPKKSLRVNAHDIGCSVNTIRKYMEKKTVKEDKEEDWIDVLLDKEDTLKDVPESKKKVVFDDEDDELLDWINKIDL